MNKGLIPVISDDQLSGAASALVGPNGFSQDCDWHNQQCALKRAGKKLLPKFDPEAGRKWEVSFLILRLVRSILRLLNSNLGIRQIHQFCQ